MVFSPLASSCWQRVHFVVKSASCSHCRYDLIMHYQQQQAKQHRPNDVSPSLSASLFPILPLTPSPSPSFTYIASCHLWVVLHDAALADIDPVLETKQRGHHTTLAQSHSATCRLLPSHTDLPLHTRPHKTQRCLTPPHFTPLPPCPLFSHTLSCVCGVVGSLTAHRMTPHTEQKFKKRETREEEGGRSSGGEQERGGRTCE